jgi:hypothetical protein
MDKKRDRSLRKMLQCPIRDTVTTRDLAEFKAQDSFMSLCRDGQLWVAAGVRKYVCSAT